MAKTPSKKSAKAPKKAGKGAEKNKKRVESYARSAGGAAAQRSGMKENSL